MYFPMRMTLLRILLTSLIFSVFGRSVSSRQRHGKTSNLRGSLDPQVIKLKSSTLTNVWTASSSAPIAAWVASASSSNGEYLYAVVESGLIYSSYDYGVSWSSYSLGEPDWTAIACSSNGFYVLVCATNSPVYLSDSYGATFSTVTDLPTAYWQGVAVSSSGDVMAAVGYDEFIYISLNYGTTWVQTAGTSTYAWKSIAMSSTGLYMTAAVSEGSLHQSSNYGTTFTVANDLNASYPFEAVAMSSSGEFASAVTCTGTIYYTSDSGTSWSTSDVGAESDACWSSIAVSESGQYQLATQDSGYIYMSSDYGQTWSVSDSPSDPWFSVSSSSSGQLAIATVSEGSIYLGNISIPADTSSTTPTVQPTVSSTEVFTWTEVFGASYGADWSAVASDASGMFLVVTAAGDSIYTSANGGEQWDASSATGGENEAWVSVAVSANGSVTAAAAVDSGYVIVSSDYQDVWYQNSGVGEWVSVTMSSTGGLIFAAQYHGGIYRTTDVGTTWSITAAPAPQNWSSVSLSSESTYLLATCVNGYAYFSSNSGNDWTALTETPDGVKWKASAVSSTGQYLMVSGEDLGIYYSLDFADSWALSDAPTDEVWTSLTFSASGQIAAASAYGNAVFVSSTYGATWQVCSNLGGGDWISVALNSAGSQLLVAGGSYGVYLGYATYSMPPSVSPTAAPTSNSSSSSSSVPTMTPTSAAPTATLAPSVSPTTSQPTLTPASSGSPSVTPSAVPSISESPTRQPSIQNSPIVTFSVNVTLTQLTSELLNVNCQDAIIATTAFWMGVESSAVVYVGSYPVPVVRRLGGSNSIVSSSSGGNYSLIVETLTSTSVAATSYTNSSNLYYECVQKLDTAIENGYYTITLQTESESQNYDAVATQSAVATLVSESLPVVVQEPTNSPTAAPTSSTAPGRLESVGTIVPGVLLFLLVLTILHLRDPLKAALNELNSYFSEVMDAAVKCFVIILSVNLIAEYASDPDSPSFLLLIFAKLALFALWCFFIVAFFFPVRTINGKPGLQLSLLLHKEPFKVKLSFSVYGLLMTMSMFDMTFLRLMPWIRTNLTDSLQGYPDTFMLRCCLYGTFFSYLIQSLAIIIRIAVESKNAGNGTNSEENREKAILLLAFTVFNVFRAFISMLFVVRVSQSDKLKLAVVNEGDVAVLADFMRKTEALVDDSNSNTSGGAAGSGRDKKKSFTPGRISSMLFGVSGLDSSNNSHVSDTVASAEQSAYAQNPLNRTASNVADVSSVLGADGDVPLSDLTELDLIEPLFASNTKFADETLEILRSQLKKDGKVPVEFIPLEELKVEIAGIFSKANNGEPYDEARLDYLLMCMDFNPEYKAEKELEAKKWRSEIGSFASECRAVMRGFVPPFIFHASQESLVSEYGMSKELAKRIIMKKCLWLVRVSVADIDRMHIAELQGRFNPEAQGLDIVETAAIFQSIPEKFGNDPDGKKERWRASLEQNLKNLVSEKVSGKLVKSKLRNPAYTNQTPPFAHRESMHEMNITSGEDAFKPRSSFRMLGTRSIQDQQQRNSETASPLSRSSISNRQGRSTSSSSYGGAGSGLPPPARPAITPVGQTRGSVRSSGIGETLSKMFASRSNSNNSNNNNGRDASGGVDGNTLHSSDNDSSNSSSSSAVNDQL